jgi:hypothetical protein
MTVAPDGRYARVVRTVVASCASLEGFSIDDLGDVRLLVDTAFHALLEVGSGPVDVVVQPSAQQLDIVMSAARRTGRRWAEEGLQLLETVASVAAVDRSFEERDHELVLRVRVQAHDDGH